MITDQNGFLLFGTDQGIAKFNGQRFSNAEDFGKFQDATSLWLYKFQDSIIFTSYCNNKIITKNKKNGVYDFGYYLKGSNCFNRLVECNGELYTYYLRYVYHLNKIENKFCFDSTRYKFDRSLTYIHSMVSFNNKLYISRDSSLYQYFDNNSISGIDHFLNGSMHKLYSFNDNIYITTLNKIYAGKSFNDVKPILELNRKQKIGLFLPLKNNALIYEIIGEGIYYKNLFDGQIKKIQDINHQIYFIKEDDYHNIWIGTLGDGLYQLSQNILNEVPNINNQLMYITDIEWGDKNKILVGALKGLMIYDSISKHLVPHTDDFAQQFVWDIEYNQEHDKFIVANIKGYLKKNKFKYLNEKDSSIICIRSRTTKVVGERIYFGQWTEYLSSLNFENMEKHVIHVFTKTMDSIQPVRIKANSIINKDNQLLIGTSLGLYVFNLKTNKFEEVVTEKAINIIKEDSENNIWIVSSDEIFKLIKKQGTWELTEAIYKGYSFKDIAFSEYDDLHFIATNEGVLVKLPNDMKLLINENSGLISKQINCLKYHKQTKTLWIGTTSGLFQLNTQQFLNQLYNVPIPYISYQSQTFFNKKSIVLQPDEGNLVFGFDALSFIQAKNVQFRYRINNSEWVYPEELSVNLFLEKSGTYNIELSTSNYGVLWSEPLVLSIKKKPFFYQTLIFTILVSLLAALLIFIAVYKRIQVIKKREQAKRDYEKQIVEYRFKALSGAINPHFIFNSLNSLQYLVRIKDNLLANQYIKNFAQLLRLNIDDLEESFVSLEREIERIENFIFIEKIKFKNRIEFSKNIDKNIDPKEVKIPGMILQPFVENSIKHGLGRDNTLLIEIEIFIKEKHLIIRINDNGIGEKENESHKKGKGIKLIKNRLQTTYNQFDYDFIFVNQNIEKGFSVEIRIPKS
jgi:hypothetical protein